MALAPMLTLHVPGMPPPCSLCSVKVMHEHINPKNGEPAPLIAEDIYNIVMEVSSGGRLHAAGSL